ncbi:hypothetical protein [Psychrobacter sp. 16-MNA-CIBAN-0192]|uniref:hypothetical protein n=1 Tax=Psychrobacter sp. 16-MNA-CIBAN-0192 TaxID=3140448 RepID=UPI0033181415
MQTKDPALTKTLIVDGKDKTDHLHTGEHHHVTPELIHDDLHHKGTETLQETVIGTLYTSDHIFDDVIHEHDGHLHGQYDSAVPHDESIHHGDHRVQRALDEHKNTATFQETVVGSGHIPEDHIDEGDILARYPDRRDQEGNAFDDGINEHSVRSEVPKSESINDMNRYATIDNAQTRVLNPDEK